MELKRPIPDDRTYEQLKNHYLAERILGDKLRRANQEERKKLYATMYDELFSLVPDHPRLQIRNDWSATSRENEGKLALIAPFLSKEIAFAEFAPGDCRFAMEVATRVRFVNAIDISDQRNPSDVVPVNFNLTIYNGYDLSEIEDGSIDLAFSDQFIEHLHPDDTKFHLQLVHRILKTRGKYVFRTPHYLTGPHDISMYFSDEPEGLHLKEWTFSGLRPLLKEVGYRRVLVYRKVKSIVFPVPYFFYSVTEKILSVFPKSKTRKISNKLVGSLIVAAVK